MDKNLLKRIIFGALYALVVMACTHPKGSQTLQAIFPTIKQYHLYFGLIVFFMVVGTWECFKIMKLNGAWEKYAVFPLVILVFYRFSLRYFHHGFTYNFTIAEILGLLLVLIAIITLFRFKDELYYDNGKLIFIVIYVGLSFSYALTLPDFTETHFSLEPFFLFLLIWASDSFAYVTGRLFGKHKMAPKVSPKKTWEGFAGGVVLTLILSYFIESSVPYLRGNWIIVGFLVSIFAPLGDLIESQLKRTFGVKDSGNIIPGHGGILDRLDSFMLCAPVLYLYFIIDQFFI